MSALQNIVKQILGDEMNEREVLFTRHHDGSCYYLKFDSNFWYVECYDDFTWDFCWCLKFENYFDAINCYRSEVGD